MKRSDLLLFIEVLGAILVFVLFQATVQVAIEKHHDKKPRAYFGRMK